MTGAFPTMFVGKCCGVTGTSARQCGWSHDEWNPSDPRHLELHHIKHHVKGGENVEGNLKTLCTVCHDKVHRREKKGT